MKRDLQRTYWPYAVILLSAGILTVLSILWFRAESERARLRQGEILDALGRHQIRLLAIEIERLEGELSQGAGPLAGARVRVNPDGILHPRWLSTHESPIEDERVSKARQLAYSGAPSSEVISAYQRAVADPKAASEARLGLAGYHLGQGRNLEAANLARSLLEDDAAGPEHRLQAALLWAKSGEDRETAIREILALIDTRGSVVRPPLMRFVLDELATLSGFGEAVPHRRDALERLWMRMGELAGEAVTLISLEKGGRRVRYVRRPGVVIGVASLSATDTLIFDVSTEALRSHLATRLSQGRVRWKITTGGPANGLALPDPLPDHSLVLESSPENLVSPIAWPLIAIPGVALVGLGVGLTAAYRADRRVRELASLRRDLIANVSHEMRTPLSVIQMYSELLLRDTPQGTEVSEQTQVILRESLRLKGLVENLLTLGRMDRKAFALKPRPVDLDELAGQTVETLRPWLVREDLTLDHRRAGTHARVDRDLAAQVMLNLLENAVKYTVAHENGSKGRPSIVVRCARAGDEVEFRVEDSGPGVPLDEREKIFERFARGAWARNSDVRGLGLGLALAREGARMMGGDVTVTDREGGGAVFIFRVPADDTNTGR